MLSKVKWLYKPIGGFFCQFGSETFKIPRLPPPPPTSFPLFGLATYLDHCSNSTTDSTSLFPIFGREILPMRICFALSSFLSSLAVSTPSLLLPLSALVAVARFLSKKKIAKFSLHSLVARSLARSFARSLARSLDRRC